ncbi:MAG: BatA domain-containing protein [Vicinamibacterales bacterium]
MGFLTPLFLVGLAGLAVPVIIHLIQRERKTIVEFPSLMFLRRIPYQSVRRRHIRNWPLLLLRLLALALIVAAFARPFLRRESLSAAAAGEARELVILVDRSYSLDYGDRWTRAVALARDRINQMAPADRASIVFFDTGAEVVLRSASDKGRLTAAVNGGKPTAAATKFGPALKLAGSILSESALPNKEVVLVSDFQRVAWVGAEGVRLPDGATLSPRPVVDEHPVNVSVTPAVLQRSTLNEQTRVTVTAGAIATGAAVAALPVTLEVDGRAIQTRTVALTAGGSASVTFDPFAPSSAFTRGTVRIPDDRLVRDNAYHFVVSPMDKVRVFLAGRAAGPREASLYLARALELGDAPSFDVVQVGSDLDSLGTSAEASGRSGAGPAVVILNDVAVSPLLAKKLETYVDGGGGLLVALGPRASWPAATDILPGGLGEAVDRTRGIAGRMGALEYGHPVFESFRAPRSGDFSSARFYTYRSVTPAPGAEILARYDDGAPALLERRIGRGRVMLWTSALDVGWNDLALKPVFLPFIHRVTANLASYTQRRASMSVGEVLRGGDPGVPSSGRSALTPSGSRVPLGDQTTGVVELREQGFYEIRQDDRDVAPMTVASNVDLSESDLTPVNPRDVAAGATGKAGGAAPAGSNTTFTRDERERAQRVWWYLLLAGMLLLALETGLSNRMGKVRV